jgi:hypothetical protein
LATTNLERLRKFVRMNRVRWSRQISKPVFVCDVSS